MAPKARFVACVVPKLVAKHSYPPGTKPQGDQKYEMTLDEGNVIKAQMKGIPVKAAHMPSTRAGEVTRAWIDSKNRMMAEFEIPLEGFEMAVANLVNRKHIFGVSLRHNQTTLTPDELTICLEGAREGAVVEYRLPVSGYEAKHDPRTNQVVPPPTPSQDEFVSASAAAAAKSNPSLYSPPGHDVWITASTNSTIDMSTGYQQVFQAPPVTTGNYPSYMQQQPSAPLSSPSPSQAPQTQPQAQASQAHGHTPPRGPDGRWLPVKSEQEHQAAMAQTPPPTAAQHAPVPMTDVSQTQAHPPAQQQQQASPPPQAQDPKTSWINKASQQGQAVTFTPEELDKLREHLKTQHAQNQDLANKAKQYETTKQQLEKQQQSAKEAIAQSLKEILTGYVDDAKLNALSSAISDNNMGEFINLAPDVVAASGRLKAERVQYQQWLAQQQQRPPVPTWQQAAAASFQQAPPPPPQPQRVDEQFLQQLSGALSSSTPSVDDYVNASSSKRARSDDFYSTSSSSSYSHQYEPPPRQMNTSRSSPWDISHIPDLPATDRDRQIFNQVMASTKGMDMYSFNPKQFYTSDALARMSNASGDKDPIFGSRFGQDL
jgi:hypothetical protein